MTIYTEKTGSTNATVNKTTSKGYAALNSSSGDKTQYQGSKYGIAASV